MEIWSALVPSKAAIFSFTASALSVAAPEAGLVSPVAMAKIAADLVSAANRMPSGPNASGPMDLRAGAPSVMPVVGAAWELEAKRPSARDAAARFLRSSFMVNARGFAAQVRVGKTPKPSWRAGRESSCARVLTMRFQLSQQRHKFR